jgi:hypothetical protein
MTKKAAAAENNKTESFEKHLLWTDDAYYKTASALALKNASIRVVVNLVATDETTQEQKHGSATVCLLFEGPLNEAWRQRKRVAGRHEVQKHFAFKRDRCLAAELVIVLRRRSNAEDKSNIQSSNGKLPKWDATEIEVEPVFDTDQPWTITLEFDDQKFLKWVCFSHDPDKTPKATDYLFESAIKDEEARLLSLALTTTDLYQNPRASHDDKHNEDSECGQIGCSPKSEKPEKRRRVQK